MPRTTSTFDNPLFSETSQSGKNPIYNLLVAFSEHDKELGYTQGMNFLVGIIFTAVQDEVMAFSILEKLMQSKV